MVAKPTGVDEAIDFVWSQPDAALTPSQKQSITAALAKETDVVARRFFFAPDPEHWVGTLKNLAASRGTLAVCGKLWLHFHEASEQIQSSLPAFPVA